MCDAPRRSAHAADLAIAMAVLSSIKDVPLDSKACLIGEIGLGGEVRAVPQAEFDAWVTQAKKSASLATTPRLAAN